MKNLKIRQFILSITVLGAQSFSMEDDENIHIPEAINSNNAILEQDPKYREEFSKMRGSMLHLSCYLMRTLEISFYEMDMKDLNNDETIQKIFAVFGQFMNDIDDCYKGKISFPQKDFEEHLKSLQQKHNILFSNGVSARDQISIVALLYNLWPKVLLEYNKINKISFYLDLQKGLTLKECEVSNQNKSKIFEALLTLPVGEKLLQIFYRFDVAMAWHTWVKGWFWEMHQLLEGDIVFANHMYSKLDSLKHYNENFLEAWKKATETEFRHYCLEHKVDVKTCEQQLRKIEAIANTRLEKINNELNKFEEKYIEIHSKTTVSNIKTK